REAALLDLRAQLVELAAMQEQLPMALGLVAELARRPVGADVRADEEQLLAEEAGIRILQVGPPVAQRLDLAPREHEAGLEPLAHVVVVERAAVHRDVALAGRIAHGAALCDGPGRDSSFSPKQPMLRAETGANPYPHGRRNRPPGVDGACPDPGPRRP